MLSFRWIPLVVLLWITPPLTAQPTYKLGVKPELKPQVLLDVRDRQIWRTPLLDDPGFRLQYHFRKDGASTAVIEARSRMQVPLLQQEPGSYTVVVELFYPAYKGGTAQKGEFRSVSNILSYRVEPGTPPRLVFPRYVASPGVQALLGTQASQIK